MRTGADHMSTSSPMADYLLKVYDDKIKLFTSNGRIRTGFSCDLKDIYRITYLPVATKHYSSMNGFLSFSIKNANSEYAI